MKVQTFAPCAALAPFVRAFEIVETDAEVTRTLMPDSGVIVGIRFAGAAALVEGSITHRVPDNVVTGLQPTVRHMRSAPHSGIVLAKFHEMGAAAFFDLPLHDLFGATVPLEALVPGRELRRVTSRIVDARDHADRVAHFEQFLCARRRERTPDALVEAAVRAVRAAPGEVRISALARRLHIGQDALEKRFRRVVGTSPKRLASLLRLQHAVRRYRPERSLSELALEAGYYDQAHFNRDLRAVTGEAPQRFLQSRERC